MMMNESSAQGCPPVHSGTWCHCGRPPSRAWLTPLAACLCALLLAQSGQPVQARELRGQSRATHDATAKTPGNRETLTVALHQSRVIKLRTQAARVSVADPEIADILVLDPNNIYVVGKSLGTTNLVFWDAREKPSGSILLEVTADLELLKSRLHEVLPRERIQVRSAQGAIVVNGTVSSPEKAEAAVQIAQSFANAASKDGKDGKVLNMIQIGGSQQVLLEVKIAEVSRELSKRLDMNFVGFGNGGDIKIGTAGSGTSLPDANIKHWITNPVTGEATESTDRISQFNNNNGMWGPAITEFAPGKVTSLGKTLFLQSLSGNFLFNMMIDAAKDQGLAKILAEPNLTTLSGQEADFLAGGQFPYSVAAALGQAPGTEFKNYGVSLKFVPVVLDSDVISLKVSVSVSDLDLAVRVNGTPSLKLRSATATVEVKTGETISIAGLINETLRQNVNKFPGLGDLPILGILFRSQAFVKGQTELVIFVTPRLARSFNPQQVKLPTDSFVEPSDLEFYLMGRMQGRKLRPGDEAPAGSLGPDKSGSEGAFGHDL